MNIHSIGLAIAIAAAFVPGVAAARPTAHPGDAGQASPELLQCARVQPVIDNIIAAAMARVESARLSNNPAEMRTAVDHLEAALRDIRAQLAPCSAATPATEPHPGHTMPGMPQTPGAPAGVAPIDQSKMPMAETPAAKPGAATGAKPPAPAAPRDHSKMPMGGIPATKPGAAADAKPAAPGAPMDHSKMSMGGTPTAKPGAAAGAKPAAPAAPMDHSRMPMGDKAQPGKVMDPVNGLMVDPATAPKTTYQGQTYYFSSEQTRKEFLENPAKFAKKPKG
jgi:YHS domain-containing protein